MKFGGKTTKTSSDLKRHFTVVIGGKEHGLYVSSTPSSAAKKAVTKLCAANKSKKVEFYIREITQVSKKKTYGPYSGHIEKLKEPIELKGRVIKYKSVAKLSKKKGVQKGGLQDFFNFCIKLPEQEYLSDYQINYTIKTILRIDCDIDIDREIFYHEKFLILVKVTPKTFSNNSTYILDLKKSVMDKFMDLFKTYYQKAEIFDCGIPSAPPLNIINNNNNNNSRQQNTEKDIKITLYFKDSKKIEEIHEKIKSILENIFYKNYVKNIYNKFLAFRGKTKLNKEKIEQYIEEIYRKLNDIRNVISKTTNYNFLNEVNGILSPKITEFWLENGEEKKGDLRDTN
jgi:hypothetical protein